MHFSIDRTVHTTAFDKPVVDHWLERKITQTAAGSTEKDRSDDRPLQRWTRYRLSYIPLPRYILNAPEYFQQSNIGTFYIRPNIKHMVYNRLHKAGFLNLYLSVVCVDVG